MSSGDITFPLSFAQRRLWFLDQLEPGTTFYNLPLVVPFDFPVNAGVLERGINEVVRRHEVLRTVFASLDDEPMQVIKPDMPVHLAIHDLRGLAPDEMEAETERLTVEIVQRVFDLAEGPLIRVALLRRGIQDHVFVLVMHHIVSDGWSLGIFWRELSALYNAFYVGQKSPLPELPIQYADFAVWQREQLTGERLDQLTAYWRRQLQDLPLLQLPTDRPRPPALSYRGASLAFSLPRTLSSALKVLCQREGVTLFMTLLSAFSVLLRRYSGQEDIVVGMPTASRDHEEIEGLIGFFVNALVLRLDLSGDPSFADLLQRARETSLDAIAHHELPFEKLVEELQPARDPSRNPLFQVSFQLFSAAPERDAKSSEVETIPVNRGAAVFDLAVNLWEGADEIGGQIEYTTDLFDAATIERLAAHYKTLLKNAVTSPAARLSELQILSDAEQQQLLSQGTGAAVPVPDRCVHQAFEQWARTTPDALAVSPVHALLLACMHRGTHRHNPYYVSGEPHTGGDRLIWLYDLHLLAESFGEHDWQSFIARADAKGHEAALKFLKFVWDHSAEWSRTGHLPVSKTVAASEAFRALPQRESLAEITRTGASMPGNVPTQTTWIKM